jgi:hypothetical protein
VVIPGETKQVPFTEVDDHIVNATRIADLFVEATKGRIVGVGGVEVAWVGVVAEGADFFELLLALEVLVLRVEQEWRLRPWPRAL